MAETSTIFGFMKYVSATDILSDFKKTVDSHFVNSLRESIYFPLIIITNYIFSDFFHASSSFQKKWRVSYPPMCGPGSYDQPKLLKALLCIIIIAK